MSDAVMSDAPVSDGVQIPAEPKLADALAAIPIFEGIEREHVEWFASQCRDLHLPAGEVFLKEGDPADVLTVVLTGEARFQRESAGPASPIYQIGAGRVGGMLPHSRMTHFAGTARALTPSRIAEFPAKLFPEMLGRIPEMGQRLIEVMADRIREATRLDQQSEKLAALGKLSAGLAHELNNPAAAAGRSAQSLKESITNLRGLSLNLLHRTFTVDQWEYLNHFERTACEHIDSAPAFDVLTLSDREGEILDWMEARKINDAWKHAPMLAESGLTAEQLQDFESHIGGEALGDALGRVASILSAFRELRDIVNSTARISELVKSVKEYTYMDQAVQQEVDIHQGIENTLTMLGHRLKKGVQVKREYDRTLPKVCVFGSELNQVWTNLVENAIDAMDGKGELRIRTCSEPDFILVEIGDNGPGIPAEIQSKIFEPFFTTKAVGHGTGLGLDTVFRIVQKHLGQTHVESKAGDTRFQIRLPRMKGDRRHEADMHSH